MSYSSPGRLTFVFAFTAAFGEVIRFPIIDRKIFSEVSIWLQTERHGEGRRGLARSDETFLKVLRDVPLRLLRFIVDIG